MYSFQIKLHRFFYLNQEDMINSTEIREVGTVLIKNRRLRISKFKLKVLYNYLLKISWLEIASIRSLYPGLASPSGH